MNKSNLEYNIAIHDKIAKSYERTHGEIYNEIEQDRISKEIKNAISFIKTDSKKKTALDFGCGAGNLTHHLTESGVSVIGADVSSGFLDLINSKSWKEKVSTVKLNGVDLSNIEKDSVDIVCMYSVLHHVPDYLSLLSEFVRVLKKGGVIYIDHEASDSYWSNNKSLFESLRELNKTKKKDFGKYFVINNYIDKFIRTFINKKYQREGDIHVFKDDHIEWDKIVNNLKDLGMKVEKSEDYLLFRQGYNIETFNKLREGEGDMHLLIASKV